MQDDDEEEPVMCSKCNVAFQTESEYRQHYNQEHRQLENSDSSR